MFKDILTTQQELFPQTLSFTQLHANQILTKYYEISDHTKYNLLTELLSTFYVTNIITRSLVVLFCYS